MVFTGLKRRWSEEEDLVLKTRFKTFIAEKKMPPGSVMQHVVSTKLTGRTVAQLRTKINNIIHGKQKFCL